MLLYCKIYFIYICIHLLTIYTYLYIYYIYTVNVALAVTEKSVFPTSFGSGRFQGDLFSFQKHKWLQKI